MYEALGFFSGVAITMFSAWVVYRLGCYTQKRKNERDRRKGWDS